MRGLRACASAKAMPISKSPTNSQPSVDLAGAADPEVLVEGSMNDPRVQARLNDRISKWTTTQWRSLELGLRTSKYGVSVQNGLAGQ